MGLEYTYELEIPDNGARYKGMLLRIIYSILFELTKRIKEIFPCSFLFTLI